MTAAVVAVTKPAFAADFTSCVVPTGDVIASYADGTHGIVGVGSKIGKDVVYSAGQNAMQCFCGNDGNGIQTNWMKIVDLTSDQVKVYQSQGWIYVPSGAAWGLSDVPYLAQNVDFSCSGSSSSSSSGGDGKTDGRTDGRTDGKSDGRGSIVQAAHGTNLASTGNMLFIVEIFSVGVILTATGLFLRLRTRLN